MIPAGACDSLTLPAPVGWPDPPRPAAYQGLAGAVVETIAPHTEADPVAILAQLLVAAGVTVGRGAHATVEATRHHPNEFLVLVGDSAKARKGSSWEPVARLMGRACTGFPARCSTGLSSGEGLIWALRDPVCTFRDQNPALFLIPNSPAPNPSCPDPCPAYSCVL